jgi:hypothetical protein
MPSRKTGEITMKSYVHTAISMLICVSFPVAAEEFEFVADDHSKQTKLCVAAASNDLVALKRSIRSLRRSPHEKTQVLVDSVRCNGVTPTRFARQYKAADSLAFLNQHSTHRVQELEPTVTLREIADSRDLEEAPIVTIVHVSGQ